jgi:hypothetical protein
LSNIDDFIAQFNSVEANMLQNIRHMILQSHPAIQEKFIYKCPFFMYQGPLCYFTFNKTQNRFVLGFVNGHAMLDTAKLLRADNNQTHIRHLILDPNNSNSLKIIPEYLQLALEVNNNKIKI